MSTKPTNAEIAHRPRAARVTTAIAVFVAALAVSAWVEVFPAPAFAAAPSKPITDTSYYIESSSATTAYNLGCSQGNKDAANGNRNSRVVLAFGTQVSGGNLLPATAAFISTANVETVAEQFGRGYWLCTGSDATSTLYLDLSTNNDGATPTTARGNSWGDVVTAVHNWNNSNLNAQVVVEGANDIEPSWSTFPSAKAWAQGFAAHFSGYYLDTASSDGCPQTTHTNGACNNGWNQDAEWWITWGYSPALAAPQIYFTSQANQWYQICLWAVAHYGSRENFLGVLDEYPDDHTTFTATSAWNTFVGLLYSTTSTANSPVYSMEIVYES